MTRRDIRSWMWAETVEMLDQAERLQRQFFRLAATDKTEARWEPPVDVYAGTEQVLIEVALPGVPSDRIELILAPRRARHPWRTPGAATARRHEAQRLEIPYGRFERRLGLGPGEWDLIDRRLADGCLQLLLARR